jgi:hypothetical protein
MYSTTNLKVKTMEGEGVGACSLVRNTLRVKGMLELWDGTRTSDKWVKYSHESTQTKQQVG